MRTKTTPTLRRLQTEHQELKTRLQELQETFRAIRHDEVDALVINTVKGNRVFTLKGADQSYRILIEQMKEGAALLSGTTVLYSNCGLSDMLNQPLDKIISHDIQEHIAPTHLKAFKLLIKESRKGGGKISREITLQGNNGTLVPTIMSINNVVTNEVKATYLVITNLTEHMEDDVKRYTDQLEKEVKAKTEALKNVERMAAIGETSGMVGHDIRNPLQSIEGAVYLAKEEIQSLPDGSREKKELKEIVDIIRRQTEYIDHIIADLQDFSRTPPPQFKEAEIPDLITDALSTTEIPKNIQTNIEVQDECKTVTLDPVFMKRVFLNLVENAVYAMPKGGRLAIKVFQKDGYINIHVTDTGMGIPEENRPKMFSPLFTTKAKGQGLGLAVCKKLVEAHKGNITFESKVGKGTVFEIKLPKTKSAA